MFLHFGALEHTLSLALAAAFEFTDLQERTFIRGMFARAKVELLNAYAKKHWNDKTQKALAVLSKEALELIDYRNDFAHGTIMHDKDGNWAVITFRGGNRFDGKAEPIDLDQLARACERLQQVSETYQQLADDAAAGKTKRSP